MRLASLGLVNFPRDYFSSYRVAGFAFSRITIDFLPGHSSSSKVCNSDGTDFQVREELASLAASQVGLSDGGVVVKVLAAAFEDDAAGFQDVVVPENSHLLIYLIFSPICSIRPPFR